MTVAIAREGLPNGWAVPGGINPSVEHSVNPAGKMLAEALLTREEPRKWDNYKKPCDQEFIKAAREMLEKNYGLHIDPAMKEVFMTHPTTKEDLQFDNNGALYATIAAKFVDQALRSNLLAAQTIKRITWDIRGAHATKVPKNALIAAATLPDNAAISYGDSDYTSSTITMSWIYAAAKITHEIMKHASIDIMADQLQLIGFALAAKMDTDVIATYDTAAPVGDANSNYVALGGSTDLGWDNLQTALADMRDTFPGIDPTILLTNPTTYGDLAKDAQVKAMAAGNANGAQNAITRPNVLHVGGMEIMWSNQVAAKNSYLIDPSRAGYLFEGSPEMFDGRIDGTVAFEFIGVHNYGLPLTDGLVQEGAVYRIKDNT